MFRQASDPLPLKTGTKRPELAVGIAAAAAGVIAFRALCAAVGARPFPGASIFTVIAAVLLVGSCLTLVRRLRGQADAWLTSIPTFGIAALASASTLLALMTLNYLAPCIALPVDLASFSESPFVNDIVKLRLGLAIYTPVADNNSYPYTPGAQIVTYAISWMLGGQDSIPFYRTVQFTYVLLASVVATAACDQLARCFHGESYRHRAAWPFVWLPLLVLVSVDPRFNLYNHSLHNDGLALLIAMCAFWLLTRHALTGRTWLLLPMALIPAIGFLVKQNQLVWAGIFGLYFIVSGTIAWRHIIAFAFATAACIAGALGLFYGLWGDAGTYWIFRALGDKQVSLYRSILHLFEAGMYAAIGLAAGWVLLADADARPSRRNVALWSCWLVLFAIEAYTSGLGFVTNHLGPGVMIAVCFLFVALVKLWPQADASTGRPTLWFRTCSAAAIIILVTGAIGHLRDPRSPIPDDVRRYVADVEAEFAGHAASDVLMDTGTWVYLKHGVLMKDRSAPVSLHIGANQDVNQAALTDTVSRIRGRTYAKILARQLDTEHTWYDFQNRGSGVKDAIFENYSVVRRIPGVRGLNTPWPAHLFAEILVLAPKHAATGSVSTTD